MSLSEKPVIGAEIMHPPAAAEKPSVPAKDSYFSLEKAIEEDAASPSSPLEDYDPTVKAKPHSPFYCHPQTRTSLEQLKNESRVTILQPSSLDLESGKSSELSPAGKDGSVRVWPGKCRTAPRGLKNARKEDGTGWGCGMHRLSNRQRLLAKMMIAILLVGGIVAIGVGVSKAVGGGVYKSGDQSTTIA